MSCNEYFQYCLVTFDGGPATYACVSFDTCNDCLSNGCVGFVCSTLTVGPGCTCSPMNFSGVPITVTCGAPSDAGVDAGADASPDAAGE